MDDLRGSDLTESRTTSKALGGTGTTQWVSLQKATRSCRTKCSRRWGEKALEGRVDECRLHPRNVDSLEIAQISW